jgi:hypothetical protein
MADESRVSGSSLASFDDAARIAFGMVRGDPTAEGMKAAEISRAWMTGGGFVGVPQYHVELRVLARAGDPAPAGGDTTEVPPWSCDDWFAYHDFMPGSPPALRVGARCTAPTSGYHFALVRAAPQGLNPRDLLLRLVVDEPDLANDVVTTYDVQWVEATDTRYDSVSIIPVGPTGLEIQIVE